MKKLVFMDSKKFAVEREKLLGLNHKKTVTFDQIPFENSITRKVIYSEGVYEKNFSLIGRLLREVKCMIENMEEEILTKKRIEEITIEWKEFARRLEFFLFIVGVMTIIVAPLILFNEYAYRDLSVKKGENLKCGCDN